MRQLAEVIASMVLRLKQQIGQRVLKARLLTHLGGSAAIAFQPLKFYLRQGLY